MNWKFTDQTKTVVYRTAQGGATESMLVAAPEIQAWLDEGNMPDDADMPSHEALVARSRAAALPIRQNALSVIAGLMADLLQTAMAALVAGNMTAVAAASQACTLCAAARDTIKAMGDLDLSACNDYEAMRQEYIRAWAAISATFADYPDIRTQFNKALR